MKCDIISIPLQPHIIRFFTEKITNNYEYASLIVKVCRYYYDNHNLIKRTSLEREHIKIVFGRCVRCFIYISKDKYLSFYFPFRESSSLNCLKYRDHIVDSKEVAEMSRLLLQLKDDNIYSAYIDNGNNDTPFSEYTFQIVYNLITSEAGYVRHDYDPKGERGLIHPTYHLDINYSGDSTFKVGTYSMFTKSVYEQIFDKDKDCMFIDYFQPMANRFSVKLRKNKHTKRTKKTKRTKRK